MSHLGLIDDVPELDVDVVDEPGHKKRITCIVKIKIFLIHVLRS